MTDTIRSLARVVHERLIFQRKLFGSVKFPNSLAPRHHIALSLLHASLDDATAIVDIYERHGAKLAGPCFTLLRPMNEKLKRGTWLFMCSTDDEAHNFARNDKFPNKNLAEEIERHPPFDKHHLFTDLHNNASGKFHSFTHGGAQVVGAFTASGHIEPSFRNEDIIGALKHVDSVAILTAQIVMLIFGEYVPDLANLLLDELLSLRPIST